MINFFLGENSKYKEKYIDSFILGKSKDISSKFFVVVPEQSNLERQVSLINNEENLASGLLNIEVSSYNHLAYNFFSHIGYDIKSEKKLDEIGKSILLRLVCEREKKNLKYYGNLFSKPGFIQKLKSSVSELYLYDVDETSITQILDSVEEDDEIKLKPSEIAKYQDVAYIYKIYKEELKKQGFFTPDDVLDKFCKMLEGGSDFETYHKFALEYYKNTEILFDDFTGITPIQKKIIYALSKLARDIYICVDLPQRAEESVNKIFTLSDNIKAGMPMDAVLEQRDDILNISDLFYMSKKYIYDICAQSKQEGVNIEKAKYIEDVSNSSESLVRDDLRHFAKNIFSRKKLPYDKGSAPNIKIAETDNLGYEIKYLAGQISELIKNKGYRYKDICIITRNSELYKNYIVKEFQKKDIPFFMDIKINLIESPYVECIRLALEAVVKNFSTESVLKFLNSKLFDLDFELDNYIRKIGISGIKRRSATKGFNALKNQYTDALIKFKDTVTLKSASKKDEKESITGGKISANLRTLIEDLGLNGKFDKKQEYIEKVEGNLYLARAYAPAVQIVDNLLKTIEILLGDTKMNLDEFVEIFDTALSSKDSKIMPVTNDQVLIGNLMHSRFINKKILFFIGFNSDSIPIIENNKSLISENFKNILSKNGIGLSQTIAETAYNSYYYCNMHFKTVTDMLYLTYSKTNDDAEVFAPNKIIEDTIKMFGLSKENVDHTKLYTMEDLKDYIIKNRKILLEGTKSYIELYNSLHQKLHGNIENSFVKDIEKEYPKYNVDKVDGTLIKDITNDNLTVSISSIEEYSSCPYKYFLDKILSIKQKEEFGIDASIYGLVCHDVLSQMFKLISEKQENTSMSDEEISSEIGRLVEAQKENLKYYGYTNMADAMFDNIKSVLIHSFSIYLKQVRAGTFKPLYFEKEFKTKKTSSLDSNVKYTLEGRIDRIDATDDLENLKVVDYKTGKISDTLDKEDIESGKDLQLLIYMKEAEDIIKNENSCDSKAVAGVYNKVGWDAKVYQDESYTKKELSDDDLKPTGIVVEDKLELFTSEDISVTEAQPNLLGSNIQSAWKGGNRIRNKMTYDDIERAANSAYVAIDKKVQNILDGNVKCSFTDKDMDDSSCTYCNFKSICRRKVFYKAGEDE